MNEDLSLLTYFLCNTVQVAVMTFGATLKLEFCFDCFNHSDMDERLGLQTAIKEIPYRGGRTHTGEAVRCIHHNLLNQNLQCPCGLDPQTDCLDVVIITDGKSNGPLSGAQLVKEAECLRNHPMYDNKIRVYAIGIGDGIDQNELDHIAGMNQESIFNTRNAETFIAQLHKALDKLNTGKECFNADRDLKVVI